MRSESSHGHVKGHVTRPKVVSVAQRILYVVEGRGRRSANRFLLPNPIYFLQYILCAPYQQNPLGMENSTVSSLSPPPFDLIDDEDIDMEDTIASGASTPTTTSSSFPSGHTGVYKTQHHEFLSQLSHANPNQGIWLLLVAVQPVPRYQRYGPSQRLGTVHNRPPCTVAFRCLRTLLLVLPTARNTECLGAGPFGV
jgi:hypothetical protein